MGQPAMGEVQAVSVGLGVLCCGQGRAGGEERTRCRCRRSPRPPPAPPTQFLTGGAVQAEESKEWKTNLENVVIDPLSI